MMRWFVEYREKPIGSVGLESEHVKVTIVRNDREQLEVHVSKLDGGLTVAFASVDVETIRLFVAQLHELVDQVDPRRLP